MMTNYDPIAEQYRRAKEQPWRSHVESFTLMQLIGDPTGLSVVDLACGEGFYTRMLRRRGAARVTGVDLSQGMIQLARQQEADHKLGIHYEVADARALTPTGQVDLVVAAYLLNYAQNQSELQAMCDGISRCLRGGGRFVSVNSSPSLHYPTALSYRKYGFETKVRGEWKEGAPITWTFHLSDGPVAVENYHLDVETHETALRRAGFHVIRWQAPRVSREGRAANGEAYWSTFLNNSPVVFLDCRKQTEATEDELKSL